MAAVDRGSETRWPDHIVVAGGGRWARVLLDVMCGLVPPRVAITVISAHGGEQTREWAAARGLTDRIRVHQSWPEEAFAGTAAAIVVNAPRDHARTAERMLNAGVATIVEKPIAMTAADAERLAAVAARTGTPLAPALVLRFTRYLRNYAAAVAEAGPIERLTIDWADPSVEHRYGEVKRHNADVPVYADVLPHIASMLATLGLPVPRTCDRVRVERGGELVHLECLAGDAACVMTLERGAPARRRIVQAQAGGRRIDLDFTVEPGVIRSGATVVPGDTEWDSAPRPLAAMLQAFFGSVTGGARDARLDLGLAIDACALTDVVRAHHTSHES